ncbi:hypothetical protein ACGFIE_02525 [Micromonospora sp. NPDC049275]|uniref:hypothetical protein n=1 Tax=Micromonospora sp. NPDC049275 TaxID=3364268 RepID=UPI00371A17B9
MDVEEFWSVVDRARTAAGAAADQPQRDGQPSAVAEALVVELMRLPTKLSSSPHRRRTSG